jgi:hypothetical protein
MRGKHGQCLSVNRSTRWSRCPAPRNKVSGLHYPYVLHGFGAATPVKNKYPFFFLCFRRRKGLWIATSTHYFSPELIPLLLPSSLAIVDVSLWQMRLSILKVKSGRLLFFISPNSPPSHILPVFSREPVGDMYEHRGCYPFRR